MTIKETIENLRAALQQAKELNEEKYQHAIKCKDDNEYRRRRRIAKTLYRLQNKANDMDVIICDMGMKDSELITTDFTYKAENMDVSIYMMKDEDDESITTDLA